MDSVEYGGKMSLNQEQQARLMQAISRLKRTINMLGETPVDFAAVDMIDVAIGLIERQLDMDIEFISENDEIEEDNGFLFLVEDGEGDNVVKFAPQMMKPLEDVTYADPGYENDYAPGDNGFSFLDESDDDDIPTPDELEDWFNLDFPD